MLSSVVDCKPARGAQRPRIVSLPAAVDEAPDDFGDRAVQLAELAGLNLDPWQQYVLRCMLRRSDTGLWAAYETCLLVPRQNGKSVVLEAFDLAKLYLSPPGHLILHSAHLFPTAMESFRHLTGLVRNTPELWAEVARVSKAHGEEGVELRNGSRLRFAARTVTGAGRGFSPDDVILDEAFKLPPEALSALMPALSAKPDPQLVYASSSGYPDSEILWTLVERGRAGGDETLAYLEWSADPALDADSVEAVAQANPALGFRLTEKKIAAERASMRAEDYARERLGLWAEVKIQGAINPAKWADVTDPTSEMETLGAFGVDTTPDRGWTDIGIAGQRDDGRAHVEIVEHRNGTGWVVARCVELNDEHGPLPFVIDASGPAGSMIGELQARGLEVIELGARDLGRTCVWLVDAVNDGTISHGPDDVLADAVAGARKKDVGDGLFKFTRDKSAVYISPLMAVTLAAHALIDLMPLDDVAAAYL